MSQLHDVYARVTAEIVAAIEAGAGTWKMPWHHPVDAISRPANVASNRLYRGVNVLALWVAAQKHGFPTGMWGTYRQWLAAGAQVRKGSRGTTVVLWKKLSHEDRPGQSDEGDDDGHTPRLRLLARSFSVFNAQQVDGYAAPEAAPSPVAQRVAHADEFVRALRIPTDYGPFAPQYQIHLDRILMPPVASFSEAAGYYATLIHEAAHATGAKHRLNRNFHKGFTGAELAIEEMTAELAASFILADLGLACRPRADHAAYIASWLRLLKNNPRAVFWAAGKAQAAADWMHAQQPSSYTNLT